MMRGLFYNDVFMDVVVVGCKGPNQPEATTSERSV